MAKILIIGEDASVEVRKPGSHAFKCAFGNTMATTAGRTSHSGGVRKNCDSDDYKMGKREA